MFRKRDEIDSTSRYHPPPRGGCRLGFGGHIDGESHLNKIRRAVYDDRGAEWFGSRNQTPAKNAILRRKLLDHDTSLVNAEFSQPLFLSLGLISWL